VHIRARRLRLTINSIPSTNFSFFSLVSFLFSARQLLNVFSDTERNLPPPFSFTLFLYFIIIFPLSLLHNTLGIPFPPQKKTNTSSVVLSFPSLFLCTFLFEWCAFFLCLYAFFLSKSLFFFLLSFNCLVNKPTHCLTKIPTPFLAKWSQTCVRLVLCSTLLCCCILVGKRIKKKG